MTDDAAGSRRITLTLHKPWFALYAGVRPTLVIDGRGQPAQWGEGTWQVSSMGTAPIGVYLFNRVWRFGQAEIALTSGDIPAIEYRAPALPFLRGRIRVVTPPSNRPDAG